MTESKCIDTEVMQNRHYVHCLAKAYIGLKQIILTDFKKIFP